MSDIIIPSIDKLEKIKIAFKKDRAQKIHVLSDFDRTLTKAVVGGQKSTSAIAQLRNGGFLTTNYAPRAHALYDKYSIFEHDQKLTTQEKTDKMNEWWKAHHDLLIECGLNKKSMDEIVAKRTLKFRDGALEFINLLKSNQIPLILMSGAPAYMIERYLAQDNMLSNIISIIANHYIFDKDGNMIGTQEPLIHSLNKYEITIQQFPIFEKIKNRTNVILLGDTIDDIGMITGFDYDNLLKIGFLNDKTDELLPAFKQKFDIIITDDGDMNFVNSLIQEITN